MNNKTHTDIKTYHWAERFLPAFIIPYVSLARLDRPVGIWLLLLPGWWAIALAAGGVWHMNAYDWKLFGLFGVGAVVMRAAGCVINDLWDRDLDKMVGRTRVRPLASGAVKAHQVFGFLIVLLLAGLFILVQMNLVTILLGILSLPLIVTYPLMKRVTWWPQAFLGLTFNFGALMGWSAVTGVVSLPGLLLYAGGIFWTLGYDTIYAHQDREDDLLAGIKSTALKLGARSKAYVAAFFTAAWVFIAVAVMMSHEVWHIVLLLPAAGHLYWQIKNWDMNDPASSLRIFKSNKDFGILILLAFSIL